MTLWQQILFVAGGVLFVTAVVVTAPYGPRVTMRRKRVCGHRHGAWVCVQEDCDGTHHYYQREGVTR